MILLFFSLLIFSFGQVYTDFIATIENADAEKDLKWWKSNHGTGMTMHWPDFEVSFLQEFVLIFL